MNVESYSGNIMNKKDKISGLLAENYYKAAKSECNMVNITGMLEEIRAIAGKDDPFRKLDDRMDNYLGESFGNEKEFLFLKTLSEDLKKLKKEFLRHDILQSVQENKDKGRQRWMELFAHELSQLNLNTCMSLLKVPGPHQSDTNMVFIKKHTTYVREERWDKSLPLFEFLINAGVAAAEVKADLHIVAGQVHLYHFFDLPRAMEHFRKAKKLIPGSAKAERIFGEYCIQSKEFEKARSHLQKALDTDKNDFENYLVLGTLYKAENRFPTAASWYNEGLKINPGKAEIYNQLLLLNENPSYYKKNSPEIDSLLVRINRLDPDFTYTSLNNAGFVHQKNAEFAKAEKSYLKAAKLHPRRIQSYVNLGYSFLEKNEPEKSEEYFKTAIRKDREAFDGYWGLVASCRKRGDWKGVIHYLKISEKYRPQWKQFIYNDFGNAYINLGNPEKAQNYYLLALKNDPEKNLGLTALCDIAELDLEMKAGLKLLREVSSLAGKDFDITFHYRTGIIYFKNNAFNKAAEHFNKAVKLDPKNPAKLEYLGLAFEKAGYREQAEEHYRRAITVSAGDNSRYYNRLGFFLSENGKVDEAIEVLKKAVAIKPDPMYYENLGYACEFKQDYENSEYYYLQALNLADTEKDTYENRLGVFYYNRKKYEEAISHYRNAIGLAPKPVYYNNLGLAYEYSQQPVKAEENYRRAIELAATDKDRHYNRLAFFLSSNNRHKEALELLEKAVRIQQLPEYFENLGYAYENMGRLKEAETSYKKAIEHASYNKDVYLNRMGIFFFNQGNLEKAVKYYKQAIGLRPAAIYYENLANACNETGNLELFEENQLKAAELEPNEGKYYFQLGWILLHKYNAVQKAKSYLKKALEIFRNTPEIEPEELLSIQFLGAAYQREGNLDKAEEIFREAYDLDSNNDLLCSFLGNVYFEKNDLEKALYYYEKALNIAPDNIINIKNAADVLEKLGETEKLVKLLETSAATNPELNENLARMYYRQQDYRNAETYYRRAVEAYPANYTYRENLAATLQQLHNHAEAANEFAAAMHYAPKEEEDVYLNLIGNCWFAQNSFDRAAEYYQKALALYPGNTVYFKNLMDAWRSAKRYDKATGLLQKKLEENPSDKNFLNTLGLLYFEMNEIDKATACFKSYIHFHPDDPLGYDNLGFCLEKTGQYPEAIAAYQQGIPYDNSFNEKIGKIYFDLEEYDNAAQFIHEALKSEPENDIYLLDLGMVLDRQDNPEEAERIVERAIGIKPLPATFEFLAGIKEKLGKTEEAMECLSEAIKHEPVYKDKYHFLLARLYERTGNAERAAENYEASIRIYPVTHYFDRWGNLLMQEGNHEKAAEVYLQALKSFPGDALFLENFNKSCSSISDEAMRKKFREQLPGSETAGRQEKVKSPGIRD